MTTVKELASIINQCNEIVKRVANGPLDPRIGKRALQAIIEGTLSPLIWNPPTWWRTPEQQLARAHQLWPNAVLPKPPKGFIPQTKSEVLLLHVPDSPDSLRDKVIAPSKDGMSYTRCSWGGIKSDVLNLCLAPNKRVYTEPVWLAFDPEHGKGECPDSFWSQPGCAASEVFSALIQFPDWSLAWCNGASSPNLSGYRLNNHDNWSSVPYLSRVDSERRLELSCRRAGIRLDHWSSPSVREC